MEISNNMNNPGGLYKINEPGVHKSRGLENAEIQHNKQRGRQGEVGKFSKMMFRSVKFADIRNAFLSKTYLRRGSTEPDFGIARPLPDNSQ